MKGWVKSPIGEADPRELKNWQAEKTRAERQVHRLVMMREWELNRIYTILGRQWLEDSTGGIFKTGLGYGINPFLEPIKDRARWSPRPVQNEMLPIFQNEVARLLGGGTNVRIRRTESATRIEVAAKLGEAVLKSQNLEQDFEGIERELARDLTVFGTGIIRTGQITDWSKTISTSMPVKACPNCKWIVEAGRVSDGMISGKAANDIVTLHGGEPSNFRMASFGGGDPRPTMDGAEYGSESAPDPRALLDRCPKCGAQGLITRDSSEDEVVDFEDAPVRKEIALNDITQGTLSPYDWFPQNCGRFDPDKRIRSWHRESIVSLDYVSRYYENGYEVRSDEDIRERALWHPQGIEDGRFGGTIMGAIDNSQQDYEDACVLRESIRQPYFEVDEKGNRQYHNLGRWIVSAGNKVLIDDVLMIRDDRSGELVPRVQVSVCQWEQFPGSMFGGPLMSYVRGLQDNVNTIKAQVQTMRHTFGNPKWMIHSATSIEFAGQAYGRTQNDVFRWTGQQKPERVEGMALDPSWKEEFNFTIEGLQRVSSTRDVEVGNAPAGVTAASALQLLSDKASVTRGPRLAGKNRCIRDSFSHRLSLMSVLFTTPRQFRASGRGEDESIRSFIGTDLMGQVDVEVLTEPFVESPILGREAANGALMNTKTLVLRTAGDRQRFNEAQGVPPSIAPGDSIQIRRAKDEWLKFREMRDTPSGETRGPGGEPPIVKFRADNDTVHIEQHEEDFESSDAEQMRENWSVIEIHIAGWRDDYDRMKEAQAALKMMPPGKSPAPATNIDPETGAASIEEAAANTNEWMAKRMLALKLASMPKLPELQILDMWLKRLKAVSFEMSEDDFDLLVWRSHIEGHYESREQKEAALRAGMVATPQGATDAIQPGEADPNRMGAPAQ